MARALLSPAFTPLSSISLPGLFLALHLLTRVQGGGPKLPGAHTPPGRGSAGGQGAPAWEGQGQRNVAGPATFHLQPFPAHGTWHPKDPTASRTIAPTTPGTQQTEQAEVASRKHWRSALKKGARKQGARNKDRTRFVRAMRSGAFQARSRRRALESGGLESQGLKALETLAAVGAPCNRQCAFNRALLKLVNALRKSHGKKPLCLSNKLTRAAKWHSDDMLLNNYFAHDGLDGTPPWDRISNAGFKWTRAAENIAKGYFKVGAVFGAWQRSSGHLRNMLGDYAFMGAYKSGKYWTQDFAKPRTAGEACNN